MTVQNIGFSLGPLLSMQDVLACANAADSHQSIDSLWVPESWGRESFATLGAMSQVTKKTRLGTSIISIYARTPATVAMGATTLDMLSGNRTVIGLGTSTETIVENWHGLKFEKPASRMKEYVECLRLLISGEKVNYHGKFFRVNNFKIMSPSKRKNIPIFIAAVNKNMMSLASEIADGVLLYLRPVDELKKTVSELKKTTKGRDFEIATSFICAVSDKEPDKARERAAKTLAFYVSVGKYYSKFLSESGFQEEVDNITSAYGKGGSDAARRFVSDSMLDSLAICGSRKDCQKSLAKFLATGITLAIMQVNPVTDSEGSFREMLSTF